MFYRRVPNDSETMETKTINPVGTPDWHVAELASLDSHTLDGITIVIKGTLRYEGKASSAEYIARQYADSSLQALYDRLSGQFWLLVADERNGKVHLVNDPIGAQPCYFTYQQNTLFIASSLKSFEAQDDVQLTLSNQALYNYFYFHCIPAPTTIYNECEKLQAGVCVSVSQGGEKQLENLYRPLFAQGSVAAAGLEETCLSVIEESVAERMTDDCGAFLSGGLDSSTVVGMMARTKANPKSFSIGFEQKEFDESYYAKVTATHFDSNHHTLILQPDEAAGEFVNVAQYFDEPFGNSSAMATYFCARFAKQNGVDHLLAGDGGDEIFAGNARYAKQKIFEVFHNSPAVLQSLARGVFGNKVMGRIPGVKKVTSYIRQADVPLPDRLEAYNFIHLLGEQTMFSKDFLDSVDTQQPLTQQQQRYADCHSVHPVDRMLYLDWKITLADNDLVKVNKMCELADVDVSFPLLDRRVLDFSCSVPADTKLPGGKLRDFYKRSCRGFLSDETLDKEKHGFGLPFGLWLKENDALKLLVSECLDAFSKRNIVSSELINQTLKAHEQAHAGYYGELIWLMVVLELWLQGKNL